MTTIGLYLQIVSVMKTMFWHSDSNMDHHENIVMIWIYTHINVCGIEMGFKNIYNEYCNLPNMACFVVHIHHFTSVVKSCIHKE